MYLNIKLKEAETVFKKCLMCIHSLWLKVDLSAEYAALYSYRSVWLMGGKLLCVHANIAACESLP